MTTNHITWTVTHTLQALGIAVPSLTHTGLLHARERHPIDGVTLLRWLRERPELIAQALDEADENTAANLVGTLAVTGASLDELLNVAGEGV